MKNQFYLFQRIVRQTMNRYAVTYRLGAFVMLAIFLVTLSGVSAGTGHDCCGNCADTAPPHPMHAATLLVSSGCCPAEAPCACTFEPTGDRQLPAYSIAHVNTIGDDQVASLASAASETSTAAGNRLPAPPPRVAGNQPGAVPLYLTHQSFLC